MALFPAFIDLNKKRILLIGAGNVAARKAEQLLKFVPQVDCIATFARDEMAELARNGRINFSQKSAELEDLDGYDLVIVAVDDIELQKRVFAHCEARKVLCNSVDSPDFCNFIFPSLIVKDDFVVGLSSSGVAPGVTSFIRKRLESQIPENIGKILKDVRGLREELKTQGLSVAERSERVIAYVAEKFKKP